MSSQKLKKRYRQNDQHIWKTQQQQKPQAMIKNTCKRNFLLVSSSGLKYSQSLSFPDCGSQAQFCNLSVQILS